MNDNVLFGKYKVICTLGKGGYSTVILARHIMLDSFRAIKVIEKDNFLHDRLVKEAYILKNLHHECIPTIYDIEEDEKASYIIEEYCKGISLKKERSMWEEYDKLKIIDYSLQICDLIGYLHEGGHRILYLDLKPENLIVCNGKIMLVDFGAAIFAQEARNMNVSMGTRGYAAPEQCNLNARPDARSDIYGIGCIIRFLKYGSVNDNGKGFLSGDKKDELDNVINRCLMKNPNMRYGDVEKLVQDLKKLVNKDNKVSYMSKCCGNHFVDVMRKLRKKAVSYNKFCKKSKDIYNESGNKVLSISVTGTHNGAGTTGCALMLAKYFAEFQKNNVLLIDMSDNGDVSDMFGGEYDEYGEDMEYGMVNTKKITTIKEREVCKNSNDFYSYIDGRFDVIIVDFGVMNARHIDSFIKTDVNIVVTSVCEWKLRKLVSFIDRYNSFDNNKKWIYVCDSYYKKYHYIEKMYAIKMIDIRRFKDKCISEENYLCTFAQTVLQQISSDHFNSRREDVFAQK